MNDVTFDMAVYTTCCLVAVHSYRNGGLCAPCQGRGVETCTARGHYRPVARLLEAIRGARSSSSPHSIILTPCLIKTCVCLRTRSQQKLTGNDPY